jgi:RNA polymerase sigma-70 factor, ECF subfamily
MRDRQCLARLFEEQRSRLTVVAFRMLGSRSDAHDAVQEAWLRLDRTDTSDVDNLSGWLTTVVGRVCLDMLRQRKARREQPQGVHLPDPVVEPWPTSGPEEQAVLSDQVGLALLVVLDTLTPAERLAFVLHDMFAVPFDAIARLLDRSPSAAKMLASRARHRIQGSPVPETDLARQRAVIEAFFTAARDGDFEALVALLSPEASLRSDGGPTLPHLSQLIHGATEVAKLALAGARPRSEIRFVLVNNAAGAIITRDGRPFTLMAFTVIGGSIAAIDILADPDRLQHIGSGIQDD